MRARLLLILTLLCSLASGYPSEDRVAEARRDKGAGLRAAFKRTGLAYPPAGVHLRAFKTEGVLEVWVGAPGKRKKHFKTYRIGAMSGGLGPKKEMGDMQVPEGVYRVDRFNTRSRFLLSLGLNYPNALDLRRSEGLNPGSDIFIHGGRASIGCVAMTDDQIQEIFLIAYDAKRKPVTVDVYPMRMEGPRYAAAKRAAPEEWRELWRLLERRYRAFEKNRI